MRARRRFAACLCSAVALAALMCGASCTYDFTVGPPKSAPSGAEAGDATTIDGSTGFDGTTPVDCAALKSNLDEQRARARACSFAGGLCGDIVQDECNCNMGTVNKNAVAVQKFAEMATDYRNAGCAATTCSGCLGSNLPGLPGHICEADGGSIGFCVDPTLSE